PWARGRAATASPRKRQAALRRDERCRLAPRDYAMYDCADHRGSSAGKRIHSGFARGQAKMAARSALVQADSDGRRARPTVAGRVRHAGAEFDADMTVNALATGGFLDRRDSRLKRAASLGRARCGLVAGLKLVGPRGFARAKANSGGATADRNKNIAQIHLEP
ncbi:MAG: hypothetical protein ACREDM_17165, partial [Methylocella sp.]